MSFGYDAAGSPPPLPSAQAFAGQPQAPEPRLSKLSLASFLVAVLSPVGVCFCYPTLIASFAALVMSHVALFRIWRSGGTQWGTVWAVLAMLISYPLFAGGVLWMMIPPIDTANLPKVDPSSPQARLDAVELRIMTDAHGVTHGNTPEAEELAAQFSEDMKTLREGLFTESKTKIKLSGDEFITHCELHEGRCAFVVHVPDLRHFEDDAEQSLASLAWRIANEVVSEQLEAGDELAVGLRGTFLYGPVLVGKVGDEEESRRSKSGDALLPFFKLPPTAAADTPATEVPSGAGTPADSSDPTKEEGAKEPSAIE